MQFTDCLFFFTKLPWLITKFLRMSLSPCISTSWWSLQKTGAAGLWPWFPWTRRLVSSLIHVCFERQSAEHQVPHILQAVNEKPLKNEKLWRQLSKVTERCFIWENVSSLVRLHNSDLKIDLFLKKELYIKLYRLLNVNWLLLTMFLLTFFWLKQDIQCASGNLNLGICINKVYGIIIFLC